MESFIGEPRPYEPTRPHIETDEEPYQKPPGIESSVEQTDENDNVVTEPNLPTVADLPLRAEEADESKAGIRERFAESSGPLRRFLLSAWYYFVYYLDCVCHPRLCLLDRRYRDELWKMKNNQIMVVDSNSKGDSGKTALISWLGSRDSDVMGPSVIGLDGNENSGHLARRVGVSIDPENSGDRDNGTITLQGCINNIDELSEYSSFAKQVLAARETGLFVIGSDPPKNRPIRKHQVYTMLETLKGNCRSLYVDTGNDISRWVTTCSVERADQLIIVGRVTSNEVMLDIQVTLDVFRKNELREKVDKAIFVLFGGKQKDRKAAAKRYNVSEEQIYIVPRNRYMERYNVVSFLRVPIRVRVALDEILLAIYRPLNGANTELPLAPRG
jgi:MinD-like ATPase involved in chromosome partitioning or flagellar assembly